MVVNVGILEVCIIYGLKNRDNLVLLLVDLDLDARDTNFLDSERRLFDSLYLLVTKTNFATPTNNKKRFHKSLHIIPCTRTNTKEYRKAQA